MHTVSHEQMRQRCWKSNARSYLELIRAFVASDPSDREMKDLLEAIERDTVAVTPVIN
ncbi:MAG: hypothetical protein ABI411_11840 [Tahibacter sp.]